MGAFLESGAKTVWAGMGVVCLASLLTRSRAVRGGMRIGHPNEIFVVYTS